MLVLARELFGHMWNPAFISAIIDHDVAEYKTGDIPANLKWRNKALKTEYEKVKKKIESDLAISHRLTKKEQQALEFCDRLEHMIFCLEQRHLGNTYVDRPFKRLVAHVSGKLGFPNINCGDLFKFVINQYGQITNQSSYRNFK